MPEHKIKAIKRRRALSDVSPLFVQASYVTPEKYHDQTNSPQASRAYPTALSELWKTLRPRT